MEGTRVSVEQESTGGDFSLSAVLYLWNFEPYKHLKVLQFLFILKIRNRGTWVAHVGEASNSWF